MNPRASVDRAPKVSVIVATYNMGLHLCEAIDSILAQTFTDLEVIVIDDGSTDDTQKRLSRFSAEPRVQIVAQDNLGQPKAKNVGIRMARGQFIAFCDADDYWLPRKLDLQLPLFVTNSLTGVVYSPATALHADGVQHELHGPKYLRGSVLAEMFVSNIVPFGTAVVRRECIDEIGLFDESIPMGIDWDWWLRISTKWHFDFVPESTYVYRIWDGQMSKNWQGRYQCALTIMENFLRSYPDRVPKDIVNLAYADTYTNLARHHLQYFGIRRGMITVWKALSYKLGFWPAWRLLVGSPYHRLRAVLQG